MRLPVWVGVRGANVAASSGALPRKIARERRQPLEESRGEPAGKGRGTERSDIGGILLTVRSRPLIKSLLNRITALPLAGHVAVIPNYVAAFYPLLPLESRNSCDRLYAALRYMPSVTVLAEPTERYITAL